MDRPTATKTEQTWNGLYFIAAGDDIEITTLPKLLLRLKTENALHIPYSVGLYYKHIQGHRTITELNNEAQIFFLYQVFYYSLKDFKDVLIIIKVITMDVVHLTL